MPDTKETIEKIPAHLLERSRNAKPTGPEPAVDPLTEEGLGAIAVDSVVAAISQLEPLPDPCSGCAIRPTEYGGNGACQITNTLFSDLFHLDGMGVSPTLVAELQGMQVDVDEFERASKAAGAQQEYLTDLFGSNEVALWAADSDTPAPYGEPVQVCLKPLVDKFNEGTVLNFDILKEAAVNIRHARDLGMKP